MKPFTWRDTDCLMVAALVPMRCTGCLFKDTAHTEENCPHTDAEADVICDANNDVIFIKDTEDAMVAYVVKKLEGV